MNRQEGINEIFLAFIMTMGQSFVEYQKLTGQLSPEVMRVALYQLALLNKAYDLLLPLMPELGEVTLAQAEQNWLDNPLNQG